MTPAQAWQRMLDGNRRFVNDETSQIVKDASRRASLSAGQHPFAQIFGCSDSRAAAELIFDQGLGELFVVRTAGHVLDASVIGSLEFGVEVLGIPLIVILGHDSCGAVRASIDALESGDTPGGYIRDVVTKVLPSTVSVSAAHPDSLTPELVVAEHVQQTARLLCDRSRIIRDAIDRGELALVGATYRLAEGSIHVEGNIGDIGAS